MIEQNPKALTHEEQPVAEIGYDDGPYSVVEKIDDLLRQNGFKLVDLTSDENDTAILITIERLDKVVET